ncbi:MAG: glycosyltransferase [Pseudomonadales bacterium]|jgi:MGT family glycosyltransferase
MTTAKTIAFFPEAAFGPALNCVGIAQELKKMGHNPVFVCDRGFAGVFAEYGFKEYLVNMSGDMSDEEVANYWDDFIANHLPHFHLSPIDQIETYVAPVWEAIVESAICAEDDLKRQLDIIKPDLICVDNVIMFPAITQAGCPWIRIISCSENEITDPLVPPHLSGCSQGDVKGFDQFQTRFEKAVAKTHSDFNSFLAAKDLPPYPAGEFFEPSPTMNFLLYPKPLAFERAHPLPESQFQYLEGCVRNDGEYLVPDFPEVLQDAPLIYVAFGSLGDADVELYQRMLATFAKLPYRFLMKVGEDLSVYDKPANVHLQNWYPQPAVVPQVDLFIHHGGNNSFNEALYFGKPAIIMPYCWDGHDNASRIDDTGYGKKLPRYSWAEDELINSIEACLSDIGMAEKLTAVQQHMQRSEGTKKAAKVINEVLQEVEA